MGTLTRWNPREELHDLERRIATLFGKEPLSKSDEKENLKMVDWAPSVDITEDEKEYLIKAEAPGVKREDIKVNLQNGVLTISGERQSEKEEKGKKVHRIERSYGSFSRSFTLPEDADEEKLSAQFKDGVLSVHVAKTAKAKEKSKEIKVG